MSERSTTPGTPKSHRGRPSRTSGAPDGGTATSGVDVTPDTVTIPRAELEQLTQDYHALRAAVELRAEQERAQAEADAAAEAELGIVTIDGVIYKRTEPRAFTMAQFDRATAVITALSSVVGAILNPVSTPPDASPMIAASNNDSSAPSGPTSAVRYNRVDGSLELDFAAMNWSSLGALIERALLQDRKLLFDVVGIVYVAEGEVFDDEYPYDGHRHRLSGGSAMMFMEGVIIFFGFYRRFLSGAGRIFSAMRGNPTP